MAELPELNEWPEGIYQLETSDPVLGGPEGIDNLQAKQLASRTKWLKAQLALLGENKQPLDATLTALANLVLTGNKLIYATGVDTFATTALSSFIRTLLDDVDDAAARDTLGAAPLVSPALSGTPTAPTAAAGVTSSQIATTEFVQTAIAKYSSVTAISVSQALTAAHRGLVLIDAAAGDRTITLPASNAALGVIDLVLRRVDLATNALTIVASGADKLMLDTTVSSVGQASTELLFAGDYLILRSDGAGKWWCVGQCQLPGSIATGFTVLSTTGASTYTVPPVLRSGRRWAKVKVTGAGGGGACKSVSPGPAGGSGGGVAEKRINLAGVATVSVTVGAGGVGGATDGAIGAVGAASTFGAYCSAQGGGAGQVNGNSPVGGVGVGGDLNYTLGNGCPAISGPGGSLFGGSGGGGVSSIASSDGSTPLRPGCGGAGRTTSAAPSGANGLVEISW
ncbi:glycine-rich domain-containing protein [Pseudomonas sp. RT6P73]